VISPGPCQSSTKLGTILVLAAVSSLSLLAHAAQPFGSATVTKVENKVNYGERKEGRSSTRPAVPQDVIRSNNFLLSESDSRAEIQYPDGTLVRIGQNTVFSFDSASRTLTLDKGSLLFHIPKGSGGGTIKTASLTAAITGTAGKVSSNIIAIVEGVVKLVPSGRLVHAGEFARRNPDGSITIAPFDPAHTNDGKLVYFHGLMPGFPEAELAATKLEPPDLHDLELLHRANNLPGSITHFFIDRPRPPVRVPKNPNNNNNGNPPIY
jgi:hypothetical protein